MNPFDTEKIKKILIELDLDLLSSMSLILVIIGFILLGWVTTNLPLLSTRVVILGSALSIISAMLAAILYFVKIRQNSQG